MNGARLLLSGVIDYAGLFPPASLPLQEVVSRYAQYRRSDARWMLGRLVVPIGRLTEVEALTDGVAPDAGDQPWGLSVLGSGSVEDDRQSLDAFRRRHQSRRLVVDSIEIGAASRLEVRSARRLARDGWEVFCEPVVPGAEAPPTTGLPERAAMIEEILDAVAVSGVRAKLRAGGVTAADIPAPAIVARTLAGCVQRGIAMKATAGLHHAVTGSYPLTYAADSQTARMLGYMNLLVAAGVAVNAGAAAVRAPDVVEALARILQLTARPVFTAGGVLEWTDAHGPLTEGPLHDIAPASRALVRSIGSCSFEEPLADAVSLGLL